MAQENSPLNTHRISLTDCRKVLKVDLLTDEQVLLIRDFLYRMVAIELQVRQQQLTNIYPINNFTDDTTKCAPLYPRKHRRAA
ncbi:hypothetical protein CLV59_103638 [Chitinophaga dinghuensis]|uniref:Uncharacterized protein n=1 Tax=Chitinophaga dinghuensis TaxID=1539050 RepID=A0A327W378_9BACT|nr:hypothetical protein CLV59_103638 [Chitinophaga dinghuensis]